MPLETKPWDIQGHINTPERQLGYLEAALEDGDPALVAAALDDIAKARGMSSVAEAAGATPESLGKANSLAEVPTLSTFMSAIQALGLRLRVEADQ